MTDSREQGRVLPSLVPKPTGLPELYVIATGGVLVDLTIFLEIKQFAQHSDHRQFHPSTISQAKGYMETVRLDPDKEAPLVDYYGILLEGPFPVPPGQEENARLVRGLGDQKTFALALLLCGKHTEFDRFIRHFPNIFGSKP